MIRNCNTLKPHKWNNNIFGDESLEQAFVANIKESGVLVPLTIKADGTIISGHRRWCAAMAAGLIDVPVKVEEYASEEQERRAFVDYNRQREKTFSQKMREATFIEETERVAAKARQSCGQGGILLKEMFPEATGQTRDKVAEQTGLGSGRQYEKAKKVWMAAEAGDETAIKLVHDIDQGTLSIHEAYKEKVLAHVTHNSGNNEWYTPAEYIKAAREVMSNIDLDPASSLKANETVKATRFYTAEEDGLKQEWTGRVWMNPPYATGLITKFCEKMAHHHTEGTVKEAIILVNNATETNWFYTLITQAGAVVFPRNRIRFFASEGKLGTPLQGQAIIYLGENTEKFLNVFKQFGWGALL